MVSNGYYYNDEIRYDGEYDGQYLLLNMMVNIMENKMVSNGQ